MQKRIAILPLLLFLTGLVLARDPFFKPTTHLGIHGGLNFNTVSFNPSLKQSFLPSYAYGLVLRHVSEPHIGLQVEINASGKGWKELIDSVGSYTRRIETITVPVMASFIAGSKTIRFAFTIGPYVSYLMEEKEAIDMPLRIVTRAHYFKSLATKWDFGFTGGIAAEVHTKIGAFAVRASYSHALTNLFPLSDDTYYFSASRQQVIHAGLMYFYTF